MTSKLYTYSLVRALYEKGKTFLDTFWPFVLRAISTDSRAFYIEEVQDTIAKQYNLYIPQNSIMVIAQRAHQNGYLEIVDRRYVLTDTGREYLSSYEHERDIDRRVNQVIEDAKDHLHQKHQLALSSDQIEDLIGSFIRTNLELAESYINPGEFQPAKDEFKHDRREIIALYDYFITAESSKPDIYRTLRDIVCGSVISIVVASHDLLQESTHYSPIDVYLDTNFLLKVLGLDFSYNNKPAEELISLMRSTGKFELKVFDFTVRELTNLLLPYEREHKYYITRVNVQTIYSSLKTQGYTPAEIREYIANINIKLNAAGLTIENTSINVRKYNPASSDLRLRLQKYKGHQAEDIQNHDLAAIQLITERRGGLVYNFKQAQSFFLTSDGKLTRYTLIENGHKDDGTIAEVIHERALTNILWLEHPKEIDDLPLRLMMSFYSNYALIDKEVWASFSKLVIEEREKGAINEMDATILLYDQQITMDTLSKYSSEDVDTMDIEWLATQIEKAKRHIEEEKKSALLAQRKEFEAISEHKEKEQEEITERERKEQEENFSLQKKEQDEHAKQEREQLKKELFQLFDARSKDERREDVQKVKDKLMAESRKEGWLVFHSLVVISAGIVIYAGFQLYPLVQQYWSNLEPTLALAGYLSFVLVILLGLKVDLLHLRSKLQEWIIDWIYQRKLRDWFPNSSDLIDPADSLDSISED